MLPQILQQHYCVTTMPPTQPSIHALKVGHPFQTPIPSRYLQLMHSGFCEGASSMCTPEAICPCGSLKPIISIQIDGCKVDLG
jgi:hypothetical protein